MYRGAIVNDHAVEYLCQLPEYPDTAPYLSPYSPDHVAEVDQRAGRQGVGTTSTTSGVDGPQVDALGRLRECVSWHHGELPVKAEATIQRVESESPVADHNARTTAVGATVAPCTEEPEASALTLLHAQGGQNAQDSPTIASVRCAKTLDISSNTQGGQVGDTPAGDVGAGFSLLSTVLADSLKGTSTFNTHQEQRRRGANRGNGTDPGGGDPPPTQSAASTCWRDWHASKARRVVYLTLTEPESSRVALAISIFTMLLIILAVITFCLDTLPHMSQQAHGALMITDIVLVVFFTLDYMARLLCCPALLPFLYSPLNFIDLLSIAPFYLQLIFSSLALGGNSHVLRVLRLVRSVRIFKISGKMGSLQVVLESLSASWDMLGMLLFLLLLALVLCSALLHFAEDSHEETLFTSIPAAFWWTQATLTTVGYGDMVPQTALGKWLAGLCMLPCAVVLAMPISVLGANFNRLWQERRQRQAAMDRAEGAGPLLTKATSAVLWHLKGVESVLQGLREDQIKLEEELLLLQAEGRARATDETPPVASIAHGEGNDAAAQAAAWFADARQQVSRARSQWAELDRTLAITTTGQCEMLQAALERTQVAYRQLQQWQQEGSYVLGEVEQLRKKLDVHTHKSLHVTRKVAYPGTTTATTVHGVSKGSSARQSTVATTVEEMRAEH